MIAACPPLRSSRRLARLAAILLVALAWLPAAAHAANHVVELRNFTIDPPALTIEAGDTVEWRVVSGRHSSTAKDDSWDSGELGQGLTFTQRFDKPGVYPYFCTPHDFMRGTITVLPAPSLWGRVKAWFGGD